MSLAQRIFDCSGQVQFAAASGDRNPMHMDPL
jgi:acyl dehydratase